MLAGDHGELACLPQEAFLWRRLRGVAVHDDGRSVRRSRAASSGGPDPGVRSAVPSGEAASCPRRHRAAPRSPR